MMGIADASAITTTITANTLPILPRLVRANSGGWGREAGGGSGHPRWSKSVRLRLKGEVHGFGFVACQGHVLSLRTVVFLPGRDCVFPSGKIRQRKTAIVAGDCIMRSLQHRKVAMHPRMDVA